MLSTEQSIVVNCTAGEVFSFVSDATNDPKWHTTVLQAVQTSPGPVGLHTTADIVYKGLGRHKMRAEVIEFDRDSRVVIEVSFVSAKGLAPRVMGKPRLSFWVKPIDGGTLLTRRVEFQPSGVFRLVERIGLVKRSNDARNIELLNNLKAAVEAKTDARDAAGQVKGEQP